jgi:N-acylneuraminate cytidylyltransferase
MKIAIIPARGGSKRIPRKNIKPFHGKPMIAWSIEAAQRSRLFDHVVVSTDDREIADLAAKHGAEVPFTRPAELSDDNTGTTEVVAHATQWALQQKWPLTAVCCVYPTAPFIQIDDLRRGLQGLESGSWAYAFPVTDFPAPIFRSFRKLPEGGIEMFFPEHFKTRSQDLPAALHDAGQFYWGRPESWLTGVHIFGPSSFVVEIPRWRVHDIDTRGDWDRAELVHRALFPAEAGS